MPLYVPWKWIERYAETVHWKSLNMKTLFHALTIEICSWTSNSLIIIGNSWKHLTLIHIKVSFFVLYTVIPGYFNEFIFEIMKWNISKIKTTQLWSTRPASMLNSFGVNSWKPVNLGGFWQRKGDFYYGNASFSTFTSWKWIFTEVLNYKCL